MRRVIWGTVLVALMLAVILGLPFAKTLRAQNGPSIRLTWVAPTSGGAPTTYNVLRGTSSNTETALASVPASQLSFTDSAGVGGTTYFYVVTATNGGGTSPKSNEVSATFLVLAPGAPAGLTAVASN